MCHDNHVSAGILHLQAIRVPCVHCGTSDLVGPGGHVPLTLPVAASLGSLTGMLRQRTSADEAGPMPCVVCPSCSRYLSVDELLPGDLAAFGQRSCVDDNHVLHGVVELISSGPHLSELKGTLMYKAGENCVVLQVGFCVRVVSSPLCELEL